MAAHNDIYKTPEAAVLNTSENASVQFYVVSIPKFLMLYIVTLGFYGLYWFYRNWASYKTANGESMWPLARAIFSIFFIHSLFAHVQLAANEREGEKFRWNDTLWANLLVLAIIISIVLDRMSFRGIGFPYTDLALMLIFPVKCYLFYQGQRAINIACGDSKGETNANFTAVNIVWIVMGGGLWLMTVYGYFLLFNGLAG